MRWARVTASQISHGRENDLFIEIDGTKGALQWRQEEPNQMMVRRNGQPHALYTRNPGAPYMNESGKAACRLPAGHPEAFFEAFANVYRAAYDNMVLRAAGQKFETDRHHLSEHQRRRRRDVLHPAIGRQQRRRRRLAAAEARPRPALNGTTSRHAMAAGAVSRGRGRRR